MSLLPDKLDFTIWRGGTFRKRFTLYQDDGVNLRNLTDYTAELVIRPKPGGEPLLSLTSANGGIVLGGADGVLEIVIRADQTSGLDWNNGVYDLTITAPLGGDTDPIIYGAFKVKGV